MRWSDERTATRSDSATPCFAEIVETVVIQAHVIDWVKFFGAPKTRPAKSLVRTCACGAQCVHRRVRGARCTALACRALSPQCAHVSCSYRTRVCTIAMYVGAHASWHYRTRRNVHERARAGTYLSDGRLTGVCEGRASR